MKFSRDIPIDDEFIIFVLLIYFHIYKISTKFVDFAVQSLFFALLLHFSFA